MMEPHDFYNLYSDDQERWLKSRPICDYCKERIQDEDLVDDNGALYHEDCFMEHMEEYMRQHRCCTENYVG